MALVEPKRGGIHPVYGLYIGGAPLDQDYKSVSTGRSTYAFASQRRNVKTISSIERELVSARDSTTTLKFDGKLEAVVASATEIGKERFLTLLERRVEEHGQETFYYMKDIHGTVVNLFDHVHNITLDAAVLEYESRADFENVTDSSYDSYEEDEIMLSRLVVESLLTSAFYEKIFIRYGHRKDFKRLPGSCLLIMALETCNASVSHDIDGAAQLFFDLTLDTYPGENVSDFANEALRLIKVMQGGYALPVNTGSRLLQKLTRTACEEFNRKVFNLLDYVKTMEHKYKVLDPRSILKDSDYPKYGPVALVSTLHEMYGRLISDHDWPALATKLPQSNNAAASGEKSGEKTDVICFRCKGPHHVKDCPKKKTSKDKSKDKDKENDPAAKRAKTTLPAWRYLEPKDLTKPLVDDDGRSWKFCTKCICKKSGKTGMYLLSHFDAEHDDDWTPPPPANEGNMASVEVPLGVPAVTTVPPSGRPLDDDPIEFQGAWCASVNLADADRVFCETIVDDTDDDDSTFDPVDEEPPPLLARTSPTAFVPIFRIPVARERNVEATDAEREPRSSTSTNGPEIISIPANGPVAHRWATAVERERYNYFRSAGIFTAINHVPPSAPLSIPDTCPHFPVNASLTCPEFSLLSSVDPPLDPSELPAPDPPSWFSRFVISLLPNSPCQPVAHMMNVFPPQVSQWFQCMTLFVFWITMMGWETLTNVMHSIVQLDSGPSRRERRRRNKLEWLRRHARGRRLPILILIPTLWMIMTNSIMSSGLKVGSPISSPDCLSQLYLYGCQTYHRVSYLDELVMLNFGTWLQFNRTKATYLFKIWKPESGHMTIQTTDVAVTSPSFPALDDCCVSVKPDEQTQETPWTQEMNSVENLCSIEPMTFGPTTTDAPTIAQAFDSLGDFDAPCAFMIMDNRSSTKQPVIFDTGASLAITHEKADFDGPLTIPKGDLRLGGMANGLKIEGVGSVTWTFSNGEGDDVCVRGLAYYVPKATARLLSPQRLFDASTGMQGRYEGDQASFRLYLQGSAPLIVEYDDRNSLPIGYATIGPVADDKFRPQMNLTLLDEANQNMTAGQKLLLHWHHRFGHLNLPAVQRLLRAVPFLSAKFAAASKCDTASMRCEICEFAKGHRRAKKSVTSTPNSDRDGALKVGHLKPGLQVSVDHFESRLLGRTFDSYGKVSSATYKGGCIFVDHCSGFLHVEHQLGFSAVETVRAKQAFEQLAMHHGVVIESYLTDSGAFKAKVFVNHIRSHEQRLRFCGANAHHKNGVAERAVQSVSNMARALILHASAHWKDGIDASLWPMAVTYATHLYNHLPNAQGLCPADVFTGSTVPRHRLKDIHVWGCPVYVLDPHLQAGQKLPRWQPRSRRGVFMGFSNLHSSEVPLVLNLQTGSITPQYHVVFDDQFSTVTSVEREIDPPDNWDQLCLENTTYIPTEPVTDDTNNPVSSPVPLGFEWLTPDEQEWAERAMTRQDTIRGALVESMPTITPPTAILPTTTASTPVTVTTTAPVSPPSPVLDATPAPSLARAAPVRADSRSSRTSTIPVPIVAAPVQAVPMVPAAAPPTPGVRRSTRATKGVFQKTRYIDEAFLSATTDVMDPAGHSAQLAYMAELFTCSDTGILDITDPRVYASKTPGSDSDMPTFQQALNGPDAAEYINAMKLEIQTLVGQNTWEAVLRPKNKPVLKGTWAFKLKRLPDGTAYRHKARFCARGDMQTEGVDFFETYAPVVQWSTIRLLLSTVLTEGWITRQVDYTNAFAQAELKEEVYVEFPRLFGPKSGTDKVLHLLKSLYGLRQAPRTFFEKLKAGLEERGWIQSEIDPCLFLKAGMMCVVYVDDTIFASASIDDLEREITSLGISTEAQRHTFALRDEGEVSAFLGIQIKKTGDNEFLLTQTGLIDKVLAVTKLTDCNGCDTPSTVEPLHTDKDGAKFEEDWAYDVVIGMLMYLAGNTRPDIAYAVHQAARFTHGARKSHAAGVKRILRYLKKTKSEGLILKPGKDHRVDCYVDADFGGLFSTEDKQNPVSVKSRTGYVITYRGAPLMWASKMQTQVALSTMEAEYIALSQSMRDLIPIREILKEIMAIVFEVSPIITYHSHSKAFADTIGTASHVIPQSTVYEDNDACLKFARMPKLTPRTKHIGIPYHWFRTQVERLEIQIESIDTTDQLGDQFTKGLPVDAFRLARKRLMGW